MASLWTASSLTRFELHFVAQPNDLGSGFRISDHTGQSEVLVLAHLHLGVLRVALDLY